MKRSTKPQPRKVAVEIEGERLSLTYNQALLTPNLLREVRETIPDEIDQTVSLLSRLILEWDMTDEKEKPWPITPEALGSLQIKELVLIQQAILGDMIPPTKKSADSGSF